MKIRDIKPEKQSMDLPSEYFYICGSRETIPKTKEVLKLMIDPPYLKACEYLYDCNIRTCNSSANCKDINHYGYITIDYETLDEQNKQIYHQLVEKGILEKQELKKYDNMILINLKVPITENTTAEEFSHQMFQLASNFQYQEIRYGRYKEEKFNEMAYQKLNAISLEGIPIWKIVLEKIQTGEIPIEENGELQIENFSISISSFARELASSGGYYFDETKKEYWFCKEFYEKHHQKNRL